MVEFDDEDVGGALRFFGEVGLLGDVARRVSPIEVSGFSSLPSDISMALNVDGSCFMNFLGEGDRNCSVEEGDTVCEVDEGEAFAFEGDDADPVGVGT